MDAQGGGPNFVLEGGSYGMLVPMCNIDAFADAMLEEGRDLPPWLWVKLSGHVK